jgi:hypothetical protein
MATWIFDDSYQMMTAIAGVPIAFVQRSLQGISTEFSTVLLANIVVLLKPSNSSDDLKYSCQSL